MPQTTSTGTPPVNQPVTRSWCCSEDSGPARPLLPAAVTATYPPWAQGLLPSLIPAVRELAGSAWPATGDDNDPAISGTTLLSKIPDTPALSDLDEILARILRHRSAACT